MFDDKTIMINSLLVVLTAFLVTLIDFIQVKLFEHKKESKLNMTVNYFDKVVFATRYDGEVSYKIKIFSQIRRILHRFTIIAFILFMIQFSIRYIMLSASYGK